ncbi:hypothetical protein BGZ61DRAFT_102687 [Ilyonectria robusta]|uniref:uncharacterized protein n=1 Tax=Ilyonectria robusta TaxID=1079257 RepID=UPI001E8DA7C2|nr:uncharacterized protein BGZ61DRAFT_102687 [Ilyonectria robusta]KAH8673027.1 hypothetical protein BGZ61DRAFT_102687 [Ilyonectria robusta]
MYNISKHPSDPGLCQISLPELPFPGSPDLSTAAGMDIPSPAGRRARPSQGRGKLLGNGLMGIDRPCILMFPTSLDGRRQLMDSNSLRKPIFTVYILSKFYTIDILVRPEIILYYYCQSQPEYTYWILALFQSILSSGPVSSLPLCQIKRLQLPPESRFPLTTRDIWNATQCRNMFSGR